MTIIEKKAIRNLEKLKDDITSTIVSISCFDQNSQRDKDLDTLYSMNDDIIDLIESTRLQVEQLEAQRAEERKRQELERKLKSRY